MLQSYFIITLRNLWRNKVYISFNVIGMGIALACCTIAYLNYEFYALHDQQHERINEIFRLNFVKQQNDRLKHVGKSPLPLFSQLKNIGDIDEVSRFIQRRGAVKYSEKLFDARVGFVENNFNNLFTIPLLHGSYESINQRNSIYIAKNLALKTFGKQNSIGEVIQFLDQGKTYDLIVAGVFEDLPLNSSFQFEAMVNIETYLAIHQIDVEDWSNSAAIFFTLNHIDNTDIVEKLISKFSDSHNLFDPKAEIMKYYPDPFAGMAYRDFEHSVAGPFREVIPLFMVIIVSVLAGLILIVTSFTFINSTIASSAKRLKEIGVRKVVGGTRSQIIGQFFGENLFTCILSLIVALPLTKILASEYSKLFPKPLITLSLSDHIGFSIFIVGIMGIASLMAGAYPALYISRFDPARILKGKLKFGKVNWLSKSLLLIQIGFSMFTIIASFLFISNVFYQNSVDLGFDTEQTVVVRFTDKKASYEALENKLLQNPKILSVTGSGDHVGRRNYASRVSSEGKVIQIAGMDIGTNYLQTMELTLVQGRDFNDQIESDYNEAVIINQKFVDHMQWDQPIGKQVIFEDSLNCYVIGVVEDFYYDTFNSEIHPLCMRFISSDNYRYLIAKTNASDVSQLEEELKVLWSSLYQSQHFDIKTGKHARYEADFTNKFILKVFVFMGSIASVLSLIGLYALVALNIEGRMKEIGIRKLLGATGRAIIQQINSSFIYIVIVGALLGASIAYILIPILMDVIWANYVNPDLLIITLGIAMLMGLAILTVAAKVYKATLVDPVNLLNDD